MEKIRSKGVTIFGWIFIIFATIGLLLSLLPRRGTTLNFNPLSFYYIYSVVGSILGLVAGIYILAVKEWARKLEIILRLAAIAIGVLYYIALPGISNEIHDAMTGDSNKARLEASYKEQLKMYKPEYQAQMLERYEKATNSLAKTMPVYMLICWSMLLVWNISIIYFFTRPKVKEQFR